MLASFGGDHPPRAREAKGIGRGRAGCCRRSIGSLEVALRRVRSRISRYSRFGGRGGKTGEGKEKPLGLLTSGFFRYVMVYLVDKAYDPNNIKRVQDGGVSSSLCSTPRGGG